MYVIGDSVIWGQLIINIIDSNLGKPSLISLAVSEALPIALISFIFIIT